MRLELPIKPMAKQSFRYSANGGGYQPAKVKRYSDAIKTLVYAQHSGAIISEPVWVDILFCFKSKKRGFKITRPDLDNLTKPVLDSLNGIIWQDDSQVCELNLKKMYGSQDMIVIEYGVINA